MRATDIRVLTQIYQMRNFEVWSPIVCFKKHPRQFWGPLKLENYSYRTREIVEARIAEGLLSQGPAGFSLQEKLGLEVWRLWIWVSCKQLATSGRSHISLDWVKGLCYLKLNLELALNMTTNVKRTVSACVLRIFLYRILYLLSTRK